MHITRIISKNISSVALMDEKNFPRQTFNKIPMRGHHLLRRDDNGFALTDASPKLLLGEKYLKKYEGLHFLDEIMSGESKTLYLPSF